MANKRKHKTLTIKQKCEIIKKIESGACGKSLARDYDVGASTISDIKRNKENILSFMSASLGKNLKTKTTKSAEYPEMEKRLHEWFLKQREKNAPVSEDLLKMKSKSIFKDVYGADRSFSGSRGWIANFRKRFGIRNLKICGEKLSANLEAATEFRNNFSHKIRELDLSLCQIYNADESGLYWKFLPERTLVSSSEKTAPGRKTSKERFTFLACTNSTGTHQLKMFVIGKSKKPRSFGTANLPVEYDSTPSAWMTSAVFKKWFFNSFVPQVKKFMRSNGLPEKALLLLDNAPSHPPVNELKTEDGMITTLFLPPNCTSLIQPMDQNVIRITKLNYKKSLLSHVMAQNAEITTVLKTITLRDAVFFLASAWEGLSREIIKNCWKVLLSFTESTEWDLEDDIPLALLMNQGNGIPSSEIANFAETIEGISGIQLTDNEVIDWLDDNNIQDSTQADSEEEQAIHEHREKIKHEDAMNALAVSMKWALENEESASDILAIQNLKEKALTALHRQKKKQTLISDFAMKTA